MGKGVHAVDVWALVCVGADMHELDVDTFFESLEVDIICQGRVFLLRDLDHSLLRSRLKLAISGTYQRPSGASLFLLPLLHRLHDISIACLFSCSTIQNNRNSVNSHKYLHICKSNGTG